MLEKRRKYLQIALNNTLEEARAIIGQIPLDERIIIEVGTPLIKKYGLRAITKIREWWEEKLFLSLQPQKSFTKKDNFFSQILKNKDNFFSKISDFFENLNINEETNQFPKFQKEISSKNLPFFPYIVADLKCMDRGKTEVEIAKGGGANGAIVLGGAPVETIDVFIQECEKNGLDAMVDMMNVESPLTVLRQLRKPPRVVILHRGVDEETFDPESEIPYYEIQRIKENYDIMVAVAGGDTIQEVQRAIFNDADIVVVWKSFYQRTSEITKLAEEFLKEIR